MLMKKRHQLLVKPKLIDHDPRGLANSLSQVSLEAWQTRMDALPSQFDNAVSDAVKLLEPKAQDFSLPRKTLTTADEIDTYVEMSNFNFRCMVYICQTCFALHPLAPLCFLFLF